MTGYERFIGNADRVLSRAPSRLASRVPRFPQKEKRKGPEEPFQSKPGAAVYCSRLSTLCGADLAWASMAVPACWRICVRVSSTVSLA